MSLTTPLSPISFPGQIGPSAANSIFDGLMHPVFQKGGYQTVPTIADRNAIPIWNEGAPVALTHEGFEKSQDGGYTSGRRQIGMMVHVLDTNKIYTLCPKGYWYNPIGAIAAEGDTEWQLLSEWVKAGLLMPNATSIRTDETGAAPTFTLTQYTPSNTDGNSCWVEVATGVGTNITGDLIPDANEAYDLGSPTKKFRDLYLSGNTLYMGGVPLSITNDSLMLDGAEIGAKGDTGNDGVDGINGVDGNDGTAGVDGINGVDGSDGINGVDGLQGGDGTDGIPGNNNYFHIAYADDIDGTGWSQDPSNKLYIGTYVDSAIEDAGAESELWQWQLVRGLDGSNGLAGTDGATGETSYLHIAYADVADGSTGFDIVVSDGKSYIGQYTDFTLADSTTYSDYKWSLIKGADGVDGIDGINGINGVDGINGGDGTDGIPGPPGSNTYFHIAYADDIGGTGWSQVADGKLYIGTYVDSIESDEPANSALWNWQLVRGLDGNNGLAGTNGSNGQTSYLHIAYADAADGTGWNQDSLDKSYIGQYTDFIEGDSNDPTKYKWSLIKGADGAAGINGVDGINGGDGTDGIPGADGTNTYFHIAYADAIDGTGWSQNADGKSYIGTYVDAIQDDAVAGSILWQWQLLGGLDGENGVPGTDGSNGQTSYLHIAYADTLDGTGWSQDSSNKSYIGQYTDFILGDSNDPTKYKWSLIKGDTGADGSQGLQGLQGGDGANGIPGNNGIDGISTYFHIAYANDADGTGWSQNPLGKLYIGTYVDFVLADANSTSELWKWQLVKGSDGENGENGIAGAPGVHGLTTYLHIAYATNSDGTTGFDVSDSLDKAYIGQYTDFVLADSTDVTKYTWSLIKGATGNPGNDGVDGNDGAPGTPGLQGLQGGKGADGIAGNNGTDGEHGFSSYFHIAYANDAQGTGWSQNPLGKLYMGTYVDFTVADASAVSNLWQWQLVKGADGANGENGIAGVDGESGQTTYLHIAYATNSTGSTGFDISDSLDKTHIGQYTDFLLNDSTDRLDYSWSLIKGATGNPGNDGATGPIGIDGPRGLIGIDGPRGFIGIDGPQGNPGDQGDTGPQGGIGEAGPRGFIGIDGPQGNPGAQGNPGGKGDTGNTGNTGPQGNTGSVGPQGNTGSVGPQGDIGIDGPQGDIGLTGSVGPQGDIGLTGATGARGDISDSILSEPLTTLPHQHIKRNDISIQKGDLVKLDINNELIKVTSAKDSSAIGILWSETAYDVNATDKSGHYMDSLNNIIPEVDRAIKSIWKVAAIGDTRVFNTNTILSLNGMKVCDQHGPVSKGDLVCSSDMPGYVMKQPVEYIITGFTDGIAHYEEQQSIHAFTIGKCMEDCTFDVSGKVEGIYGYLYCG